MTDDWLLLGLRILAAVLLYAFLAVVVYAVWRDLRAAVPPRNAATPDAANAAPVGWLSVCAGADGSAALPAGHTFALVPPATLGRDSDNQIVLPDDCVSARHALIECEQGEWVLIDLGSRNGTRLNDLPISRPTSLAHGDIIGVGGVELRFGSGPGLTATVEPER